MAISSRAAVALVYTVLSIRYTPPGGIAGRDDNER
jgi:hypothetical protein